MSILTDLYDGQIQSWEQPPQSKAYLAAVDRICDAEEALLSHLDEDGQSAYEHFVDCQMEVSHLTEAEAFSKGVRLGIHLMLDAFRDRLQ